jgi:hypothetical protein
MSLFASLAERRIQEAIARGELDNLALKGQPLPQEDLSDVPEELRMGFKILKNAGFLPEELLLRRELATLQDLLAACRDPKEEGRLRRRLSEKQLHYNILLEKNRGNPLFRRYAGKLRGRLGL